eukprot:TRINITY_DN1910_c0_g1_i6.p1 TRINITY_DN1910_c0_g1~~TRINITY_DN1910_c0_g1_i6.p1  ORF type:complete len:224 (-),score=49.56 TRINITY_DN1910_c0_g1_i6:225-896(-)
MAAADGPMPGELFLKVIVIGDGSVGKTSLLDRYVRNKFKPTTRHTIGVDFAIKEIKLDDGSPVKLKLWDIAGQERFQNMTRVFYKGSSAAAVVFDITNRGSLQGAGKWKQDVDKKVTLEDGRPLPCILMANKGDLQDRPNTVTITEIEQFAEKHGFKAWCVTSAKSGHGVASGFKNLAREAVACGAAYQANPDTSGANGGITLRDDKQSREKKSCCGGGDKPQ